MSIGNNMSLSKELNALKEKAQSILEDLQMNCNFDEEKYDEALEQLTAIDGWTQSQSTDGGYAEGHDRYAFQERRVEEMKARLDRKKAEIDLYKSFMFLVFETDYIQRLERNILSSDSEKYIFDKYELDSGPRSYFHSWGKPKISAELIFGKDRSANANWLDVEKFSLWEQREILAYFKSKCCSRLLEQAEKLLVTYPSLDTYGGINKMAAELVAINRLEEILTYGMLDVHIDVYSGGWSCGVDKQLDCELNYMLDHDFGKDVGINFRELRYQKAQAEKAKQQAELNALMGFK